MCYADYGDPAEFLSESTRTARKAHRCDECSRMIHPGESYEYVAAKWYGSISVIKTCPHCVAARQWLVTACGAWLYAGVQDDLVEHWHDHDELRSMTLGRLIVGMRRGWNDGRDEIPDREVVKASVPSMARSV